ncbi:hypothetical protein MRB53_001569 [Persea americana]|uniref:Uncharacterized protein n=1 Tax=Persea americana TaxID=3435 RepID=A0ACC2MT12_PERAE|nr:hypothetical protein MRB53_001569 [Persea americana]
MTLFQMGNKPLLQVLVLLLGFSYLLSPAARSLAYVNQDPADVVVQEQMNNRKLLMIEEKFMKENMEIDRNDYTGSGANDRHDPKTPGRS